MNGTLARQCRRLAYGPAYRKEHLPLKDFQKYTFGNYRGVLNGSYVAVGPRRKYQALKKAVRQRGISL